MKNIKNKFRLFLLMLISIIYSLQVNGQETAVIYSYNGGWVPVRVNPSSSTFILGVTFIHPAGFNSHASVSSIEIGDVPVNYTIIDQGKLSGGAYGEKYYTFRINTPITEEQIVYCGLSLVYSNGTEEKIGVAIELDYRMYPGGIITDGSNALCSTVPENLFYAGTPANDNLSPIVGKITSIHWEKKEEGSSNWSIIPNETALDFYNPRPHITTTYRRAIMRDGVYHYSNEITITVETPVSGGTITASNTTIENGGSVTFSSSKVSEGSAITYRWEQNTTGSWNTISGATSTTYTAYDLTTTTTFRRVTVNNGTDYPSNEITITVEAAVTGGSITASNTTIENGGSVSFSNSDASEGSGITYRWEQNNSGSWSVISGATSTTYTAYDLTTTTTFRRVTVNNGTDYPSNEITITVEAAVRGGSITASNTTIENGGSVSFSNSDASEGSGITYRWEQKTTGSWSTISGATSKTYSVSNLTTTTSFRRVTMKNGTSYASNEITVMVQAAPEPEPEPTPAPTPTATKNYTLTTTYTGAGATRPINDVVYTDGFGRPQQEISIAASPTGKDIVKVHQYGLFGRTEKDYLPYNATTNTGVFQASHNLGIYGADANYAFGKIEYDNSPLDRVVKQTGAGSAWHTADKGVTMSYSLSGANEVINWTVADNATAPTNSGYYGEGVLSKITTTNEDGSKTEEFKDNQDRVLLSIAYNGSEKLQTYYVYDDYGLLRFVLTPKAVNQGSSLMIEGLCYSYQYDHRQRLIEKRLPGADPIYYKYDAKDRLVLSQDGNQRQRGVWSYTLYDHKNRSIEIGETVTAPPSTIGDNYEPSMKTALQYLYYDNYDYAGVHPFNTTENISGVEKYDHVAGLQTGAKTKVLGTGTWIITTTYFDNKVRPIQVIADIYGVSGGKSIVSTKYDFIGNVLQTREKHDNDVVVSTNTYDPRGRLLTTSTSLNGSTPATMAYVYDELGRLSTKKYGNNTVSETYAYNVRGWLTEKNSSKFNMKLRYQNPIISGTTARYNGNITEWEWKQGTNTAQTYSFTYDGISRLTDNKQYAQNGSSWTLNNAFTEQGLTYDQNGNIQSLKRTANGSLTDNFSYTYNGNQLTSLSSASGSYLYDNNGNMTKDPRKNLELSYNSLNLLSEVRQSSILKAKYVYAADGTKLAVSDASNNGYDYRGSLIYKNTSGTKSLESVSFSDGRITKTNSTYVPNYYLTDHLGSVRVIFDASGGVLEQNDYYAFGEKHENRSLYASNNRFKYNGKELQTTGDLGLLDYGTRMCDNELGRWFVQDPAEQFSSPYNFCGNNPIRLVDPNGEWAGWFYNEYTGAIHYDSWYGEGDEDKIGGNGWRWMGDNGMFSNGGGLKGDIMAILGANIRLKGDARLSYNEKEKSYVTFLGKDAESFMKKQGYKKIPTQFTREENTIITFGSLGKGRVAEFLNGTIKTTIEKVGYIRNNQDILSYAEKNIVIPKVDSKFIYMTQYSYKRFSDPIIVNKGIVGFRDMMLFFSKFGNEFDYRNEIINKNK